MPRINKVIELWDSGQPIYHVGAGPLNYDNGVAQSQTWADYLEIDFENNPFDVVGLQAFMRGLVDGGPTPSGHRTPTVICTVPANARTKEEVEANAWQIRVVLSTGAHGILHTHVRQADATQAFVEACRYPFQSIGVDDGRLHQGTRGSGGQTTPAEIWGVDEVTYTKIADPWPLNPDGEIITGLKIEDKEGTANADDIAAVPGVTYGEWGPGDQGMSRGYVDAHDPPYPPEMLAARERIMAAYKRNGVRFRSGWRATDMTVEQQVEKLISEGVMDLGVGEDGANFARKLTNRPKPW